MNELSSRYASGLFSLALDLSKVEEYKSQAKSILKIFKENEEYLLILSSQFLSMDERIDLINKAFISIDDNILSFIKIIVSNNRSMYLIDIFENFISLCNKHLNILEGLVYSTKPLNNDEKAKLENAFSNKLSIKVELKNLIDTSLIGGIKVVLDNHVYDGSLKNKLFILKNSLLKGGN
ncbi:MAG: F0F1 ATP synthase subunit delta [Bacilli bacterium]